ncbi:MAG: hypothetical protein PF569_09655 [Candidatus Woesearchaeota archaeon]|jgi:hypothetical protein|nr:hypothetical protein [Candidatus Woesearchaeota archaeon]
MVDSVSDFISSFDFNEIHRVFLDSNYYQFLFPFLLSYALMYTALSYVKIFQSKKTKKPIKPIIILIALISSFYGVSFELESGMMVGDMMMFMFPSISALTMGILTMYIVGSILGKDFFKDMWRKDHSAYMYFTVGVIGLGSVLFYMGVGIFGWDYNPLNFESQWNVILAVAFLIMGVVFMFIDLVPIGIVFLLVFFAYVYNSGQDSFLGYFIDPVVFIFIIFIALFSWMNSDKEKKVKLEESIKDADISLSEKGDYGKYKKDYENRIRDIIHEGRIQNKNALDKLNKK